MPCIEFRKKTIGRWLCHQLSVSQARRGIVFGMARDRAGLFDGSIQAVDPQVGGAGAALAPTEIHGHGNATIAGRFDRLYPAHTHVDFESMFLRTRHFGLIGAARTAALK